MVGQFPENHKMENTELASFFKFLIPMILMVNRYIHLKQQRMPKSSLKLVNGMIFLCQPDYQFFVESGELSMEKSPFLFEAQ